MKLKVPLGSETFELEIVARHLADLLPHEEVNPGYLKNLVDAFARSRFQRNPVIIDASSNLILDGTHRWAAMRELGFTWIAVCKVDYASPLIELDSWARVYKHVELGLKEVLERFEAEPVEFTDVEESELTVILSRRAYLIGHQGFRDAFEKLRQLERELSKLVGNPSAYIPRSSWRQHVNNPLIILPPKPSKGDVVKMAREGYLMPPKSTRHVIPARPMGVNVPLKLLKKRVLDAELIEEVLRQKRFFLLKPPVLLDREYQEILLMFV